MCAFCIHILLLSKSYLTTRIKNISNKEFFLFLIFCLLIVLINFIIFPNLGKIWVSIGGNLEVLKKYKYIIGDSRYLTLAVFPILAMLLFKLKINDVGLVSERLGFFVLIAIFFGIGGGLFTFLIHCCGIPKVTISEVIFSIKWSLIDAFGFIFFCFAYSLKLLYTKYKNWGIYFLVPLLYGLTWPFVSPFNIFVQFGFGVVFSLCIHRSGSFLFPFLINFVANFVHVFGPWRSAFFTNYSILPASIILMLITFFIWQKEYKKLIKT